MATEQLVSSCTPGSGGPAARGGAGAQGRAGERRCAGLGRGGPGRAGRGRPYREPTRNSGPPQVARPVPWQVRYTLAVAGGTVPSHSTSSYPWGDPALPCPPESKNLPRPELSDHVGGRAGPHGRAPGLWASHRRPRGPATPSAGKRRQSTAVRTAPFSSRALATVLAPPHTSCRAQPSDAPAPSLHLGFSKSEAQGACTPRLLCGL